MANQLIPVTNDPYQTLQVLLNVNGNNLRLILTISYNEMANYWELGIADQNGNMLVDNIPLITGDWPAANILDCYQYLEIGSAYVINASNAAENDYPNSSSLGTDFVLLWGDNAN